MAEELDGVYSKLNKLETRLAVLEERHDNSSRLLEKVVDTNERLTDTLNNLNESFIKMSLKMEDMSKDISNTETQVSSIKKEMTDFQNKDNVSIMGLLNKYFPWIIVAIGAGVYYFSNFVKF